MKPTVSRLQEDYEDLVVFKSYDVAGLDDATRSRYRFIGFPQFVIVNAQGEILHTRLGYQNYESLKADLDDALAR
jgi:hypothetical protein